MTTVIATSRILTATTTLAAVLLVAIGVLLLCPRLTIAGVQLGMFGIIFAALSFTRTRRNIVSAAV